ncbi:MAG TPA: hypothetical protein VNL14_14005 [Candidatus Acidoferrales bacterium]|nr:hypothetical protein [Candidatus Acidoferrales bacterium]
MKRVLATREGLIGGLTAAGLTIRPNSVFVALPARKALWRIVRVRLGKSSILAPVLDLGPWFPFRAYKDDDAYVFGEERPLAEKLRGQTREGDHNKYQINGAAIDLSDGVIEALNMLPEQWGLREVEWEFIE